MREAGESGDRNEMSGRPSFLSINFFREISRAQDSDCSTDLFDQVIFKAGDFRRHGLEEVRSEGGEAGTADGGERFERVGKMFRKDGQAVGKDERSNRMLYFDKR